MFIPTHVRAAAIAAAVLFVAALPVFAQPEIGGLVRSRTSVTLDEDLDLVRNLQTVELDISGRVGSADFQATPVLDVGLAPDGSEELHLGVREAWTELVFRDADLRIGKQQIVWGEADGAFITDIVSPRDLSNFILPEFEEIRIGVPAARLDWYFGPAVTAQAVWVPRFVPNRMPEPDSIWFRESALGGELTIPPGVQPTKHAPDLPDTTLYNSEVYGKLSYFGRALNAEVMGGWAYDNEPVLELDPIFNQQGEITDLNVTPTHNRMIVTGGSASTTIGSVVVRGEGALYIDRSFNTTDLQEYEDGIAEHAQLHSLAGADWSLGDIDLTAQWIVNGVLDYEDELVRDQWEHTATARAQRTFFADRMTAELFTYIGIDPWDSLWRPALSWEFDDGVEAGLSADLFFGDEDGRFGYYADNDLLTAEVAFRF